jgi:hypothetical protein
MSRYSYTPIHQRPQIVVHDHDVLSGRGVTIAHHAGNQRFRTLVTTRADEAYCASYSASEKRAISEEIIRHIKSLDPPGRFLKRDGRGQVSRGLAGPWEELTEREAIHKTCQALRDCNRLDRQGYAAGVAMPPDVVQAARHLQDTGLTGKQYAARAAAELAAAQAAATIPSNKRDWGRVSPSVENAAEWLKKQRTDENTTVTPSTAASDTANGGTISYDPGSMDGPPPYEQFQPPAQYVSPPSPMYAPTPSSEGYAQAPGIVYTSSLSTGAYSHTPPLPHFPTASSGETFEPAPMYHMVPPPPGATYRQAPSPAPYPSSSDPSTVAAPADPSISGQSDQKNSEFAYSSNHGDPRLTHQGQMYAPSQSQGTSQPVALPLYTSYAAPAPTGQRYAAMQASQSIPSPYTPLAPASTGGANAYDRPVYRYHQAPPSNGSYAAAPGPVYQATPAYHPAPGPAYQSGPGYQSASAQGYHAAPTAEYQPLSAQGYQTAPAPAQGYQPESAPITQQSSSNSDLAPVYHADSDTAAFHSQTTPLTTYETSCEPDLHDNASIASPGSEPVYAPTTTAYQSFTDTSAAATQSDPNTFPGGLSDTGYSQGDLSAASAGADLLISAAYQSTVPSTSEAQGLVNASVVVATKWEGETLGL